MCSPICHNAKPSIRYTSPFDPTPSAQDVIRTGDTLIVPGAREQVNRLEALMRGEAPRTKAPKATGLNPTNYTSHSFYY